VSWQFEYTPNIWPMIASAAFLGALAAYAWKHRSTPGAVSFSFLMLGAALWALGSALEAAAVDLPTKLFWFKFQAVWRLPMAIAAFCFALEYTGRAGWLTRRNLALLSAPALVPFPFLFLEDYSLFWTRVRMEESLRVDNTALAMALNVYGMALILAATAVFAVLFIRSPLHRQPAGLILLGHLVPRIVYPLQVLNITASSSVDLTILSYNFTAAMYAVALYRFRIFDVVPVARETVLERMVDGMLVLDAAGRVADLNPAAQEILGVGRSRAVGLAATRLLEGFPGLAEMAGCRGAAESEVSVEVGERWYQVSCSPLDDRRGFRLGRLVVFRDITEGKRARELLIERQRALAAVQERERVARELHDGLGQVLGFVKMQAQAAQGLIATDPGAAESHLVRLAAVAQDAHADVREYILGAGMAEGDAPGLLVPLRRYLERFSAAYGLSVELAVGPELGDGAFGPAAQLQLLRIVQEALTNARKHARAEHVQVKLSASNGAVEVVVADDGQGFDPAQVAGDGQRFGLRFMRERAAEVGGTVEVRSAPGRSTQVVVRVPRHDAPAAASSRDAVPVDGKG
jgi:PAS domain S-box-containing protein